MNLNPFNRGSRGQETNAGTEQGAVTSPEALAARLQQECAQLTGRFRTPAEFGYDPDEHRWWIQLEGVALPEGMSKSHVPVIVLVSGNYPTEGPTDVFVPQTLTGEKGWGVSDIFGVNGDAEAKAEWSRCEMPGIAWRESDDLCRLLETLLAMLATAQRASMTLSAERLRDNGNETHPPTTEGDARR